MLFVPEVHPGVEFSQGLLGSLILPPCCVAGTSYKDLLTFKLRLDILMRVRFSSTCFVQDGSKPVKTFSEHDEL